MSEETDFGCCDAKNRYNLPEKMALDWDTVAAAIKKGESDAPKNIIAEIKGILEGESDSFTEAEKEAVVKATEKNKGNSAKLVRILNKCRAKVEA